jgi:CHAD domain-containing protein
MQLDYVKLREIKPAVSGYIKESQSLLKNCVYPDEEVIHDVRVLMKKSRSALKLTVDQLDNESFNRDMLALRSVGRLMSSRRETCVQRKILKELKKKYPEILAQIRENEKINFLLQKPSSDQSLSDEEKSACEQIESLLRKTGYRIRFHTMNKLDPKLLFKELEVTYYNVVDKYLICRNSPKPSNFHEFRKKAKDFTFQLYFFRPLNPSGIKALEKKLDSITQTLGKHHDLNQIIKVLGYKYTRDESIPAMDEFIIKIREMQDSCLAKVWPSAYRIFCPGQRLENVLGFKLLMI